MNNRSTFLQKHAEIPIDKIVSVVVPFFEGISDFIISLFLHLKWHFHWPTLYDFAEVIPLVKFKVLEIDKSFERGCNFLLIMDEIEQILAQIVQITGISLSTWPQEYFIIAFP